jgi:hypothetical protein
VPGLDVLGISVLLALRTHEAEDTTRLFRLGSKTGVRVDDVLLVLDSYRTHLWCMSWKVGGANDPGSALHNCARTLAAVEMDDLVLLLCAGGDNIPGVQIA